ncbi:MAG: hypothetical protein DHS20C11_31960 [Lysobacteraceae bacterium]|nr:MAG: hypothetical protein DHS20C11_31960 [Xanthomonadaceae bacterium]
MNSKSPVPALKKMPMGRRRAVNSSGLSAVRIDSQLGDDPIPFLIRAGLDGLKLADWAGDNTESIRSMLLTHGALLFRGFALPELSDFERVVSYCGGPLLSYTERSSPRTAVGKKTYTSTEHPQDQSIFLHNEQSYNNTFPQIISFHCVTPATQGGATPIADCRAIYQRVDPSIRQRLSDRGYMLARHYGGPFGLSWQEAFQTDSRQAVETYCSRNGIQFQWTSDQRLTTRQVRRVVACHPNTGDPLWFNHLTFFNVSTLPKQVGQALLSRCPLQQLPHNTYYGDGEPIEPEVLEHLRAAYRAQCVSFDWRRDDVLLLDNMRTAHGRSPFSGDRRVVVAMAQARAWAEIRSPNETTSV